MVLTRRNVVIGGAAGALLSASACRVAAAGTTVTPEGFGAVGDGVTDDYAAFQRMAAAVNAAGAGTVVLRPGRNYFLGRYITANNGVSDVIFQGCSGLIVEGNGARISTKGDLFRDAKTTRGLSGLRFEDCSGVQVRNMQLVGNVQQMRRTSGLTEAPTHGLLFGGCSDVLVENVLARHFSADGLYIRASRGAIGGMNRASRRFSVRNSRFLFNARQGLSVIQLRDALFEACDFSYTGYVDAGFGAGPYGNHAPSAGVDLEPNYTPTTPHPVDVLTGNITLRNCRMVGNLGAGLLAAQLYGSEPTIENVLVEQCLLQATQASASRYGLIFDAPASTMQNCTLKMADKTAFIGWYAQSPANPRFIGNIVSGTGTGLGRALLVVRRTRGAPVIEGNRFIVEGARIVPASAQRQLVQAANPNAIIRNNQFVAQP
jgi:hypothetical protein